MHYLARKALWSAVTMLLLLVGLQLGVGPLPWWVWAGEAVALVGSAALAAVELQDQR